MKSYPIWNKVQACIYKRDKSYGAQDFSECEILVGSSKKNSHTLGKVSTKRIEKEDVIKFELRVNGMTVKTMEFTNDNGRAGELLNEYDILK